MELTSGTAVLGGKTNWLRWVLLGDNKQFLLAGGYKLCRSAAFIQVREVC